MNNLNKSGKQLFPVTWHLLSVFEQRPGAPLGSPGGLQSSHLYTAAAFTQHSGGDQFEGFYKINAVHVLPAVNPSAKSLMRSS